VTGANGANAKWQALSQKDLAPVTMARVMSGPCDLVARVEAALRSLGVTPVKEEPVKASADVAASTASAAYFTAFAICFRFSFYVTINFLQRASVGIRLCVW
jgi:hypothetical protein